MIENVLSLFDGHSGCQIALKELGIIPKNYFASEIDKHAIKATMQNFPNTIQLGSVVDIDVSKLPKIDLLSGGSPCQSFSFAGKRKGAAAIAKFIEPTEQEYSEYQKNEDNAYIEFEDFIELKRAEYKQANTEIIEILTLEHYLQLKSEGYEFEGQSYLFWEYMRVLTELRKVNPEILFLLENVEMGKKWEGVLSKAIGINGLHINSDLVSAQNRERIYWLNWHTKKDGLFGYEYPNIPQPKDRGIFLKDILESEVDEKYYLSDKAISGMLSRIENHKEKGNGFGASFSDGTNKSNTISSRYYKDGSECLIKEGNHSDMDLIVAMRGCGDNNEQQLEQRKDGKTNTITSVQKDNLVLQNRDVAQKLVGGRSEDVLHEPNDKFHTLCSENGVLVRGRGVFINSRIRRLTEKECARLQTIPEWFSFDGISSTQIYRQIGNGWTIEVIKYLLSFI